MFSGIKEKIQKKLDVPDKEFEKVSRNTLKGQLVFNIIIVDFSPESEVENEAANVLETCLSNDIMVNSVDPQHLYDVPLWCCTK